MKPAAIRQRFPFAVGPRDALIHVEGPMTASRRGGAMRAAVCGVFGSARPIPIRIVRVVQLCRGSSGTRRRLRWLRWLTPGSVQEPPGNQPLAMVVIPLCRRSKNRRNICRGPQLLTNGIHQRPSARNNILLDQVGPDRAHPAQNKRLLRIRAGEVPRVHVVPTGPIRTLI